MRAGDAQKRLEEEIRKLEEEAFNRHENDERERLRLQREEERTRCVPSAAVAYWGLVCHSYLHCCLRGSVCVVCYHYVLCLRYSATYTSGQT